MDASMWVAKTGLSAQSTRMTVIANNLANVNTIGFKKDRANFEDLLYQRIVQAGAQADATAETPTGMMLGTGTRVVSTEKLHRQGNMISTENSLDVAIAGDGFFAVQQADGTIAYTRDGSFKISIEGILVTGSGEHRLNHRRRTAGAREGVLAVEPDVGLVREDQMPFVYRRPAEPRASVGGAGGGNACDCGVRCRGATRRTRKRFDQLHETGPHPPQRRDQAGHRCRR